MDQNNSHDVEMLNRNEAISAVADDAFLGEEDDDDYDDLYNDVNVGDGFLQNVKKDESLVFRNEKNDDPKVETEREPVSQSVNDPISDRDRDNVGGGGLGRVEMNTDSGVGGSGLVGVGSGLKIEPSVKVSEVENRSLNSNENGMGNVGMGIGGRQESHHNVGGNVGGDGFGNGGGGGGGGGTILFVGDLHWWTRDTELESELCKYGHVKEVKFFDEKASGKSKGYCQVEFYDPGSATACKEGMNGHVFNGRPCVVAYASPFSVKRMGEAQVNRTQQMGGQSSTGQLKRAPGDAPVKPGGPGGNNMSLGGNFQDNGNRGYGRANWRGNGNGPMNRGRGPRAMMANRGNGYGPPPMMHPQSMMNQGFDPSFRPMGNYGFPGGPTPPFSGMMPSFPPVGNVGLPGLAPHVNPAFFGRSMPMNGMGMMQLGGVDPNMWSDPNMSGWVGDEHGGRVGESSYGEEAGSDQQYGEGKEKERDWSGTSDRRVRDEWDPGYERDVPREKESVHEEEWPEKRHRDRERDRDRERERSRDRDRNRDRERGRDHRHREEKDRYADHHRDRDTEPEHDDEWDRGRLSRGQGKSRVSQKDEHRSKSRDADYGKRRRVTAE